MDVIEGCGGAGTKVGGGIIGAAGAAMGWRGAMMGASLKPPGALRICSKEGVWAMGETTGAGAGMNGAGTGAMGPGAVGDVAAPNDGARGSCGAPNAG